MCYAPTLSVRNVGDTLVNERGVSVERGECRHRLRAGRPSFGVTYSMRMTIVTVGHRYHCDHEVTNRR